MIGQAISNYRVIERLGLSGIGKVYRARNAKLNRAVAVKIWPSALAQSSQLLDLWHLWREESQRLFARRILDAAAPAFGNPHLDSFLDADFIVDRVRGRLLELAGQIAEHSEVPIKRLGGQQHEFARVRVLCLDEVLSRAGISQRASYSPCSVRFEASRGHVAFDHRSASRRRPL
jgi:hypothetical protein